ncbi:MAG: hypothetical protein ABIO45_15920 [Burkholderiaceae bacterium]
MQPAAQALIAAMLLSVCGAALADPTTPVANGSDDETLVAAARISTPMPQGRHTAIDMLAAPRYIRTDPALPNLSTGPSPLGGAARTELSEISRRWWLSRERADIGVGVGTVAYSLPGSGTRRDDEQSLRNAVPAVSVGLRYRSSPDSAVYADASSAPGLYGKGSDAYSAKLGIEWQGEPRSGWGFMQGGLGLRLDSGKIMTMRVKGGGLGVYLRSKF